MRVDHDERRSRHRPMRKRERVKERKQGWERQYEEEER
jgi:hypothetical protein